MDLLYFFFIIPCQEYGRSRAFAKLAKNKNKKQIIHRKQREIRKDFLTSCNKGRHLV